MAGTTVQHLLSTASDRRAERGWPADIVRERVRALPNVTLRFIRAKYGPHSVISDPTRGVRHLRVAGSHAGLRQPSPQVTNPAGYQETKKA